MRTKWGPGGTKWDQVGTKMDQVGAKWEQVEGQVGPSADQVGAKWGPSADQVGPSGPGGGQVGAKGDQVGAKWDQVGTAWNQVGTKWDQMKLGPMGYPKKVDFSLVLKGFSEKVCSGRPRSARLAGTPCDSLKSLLEPFSVPLLGNEKLILAMDRTRF